MRIHGRSLHLTVVPSTQDHEIRLIWRDLLIEAVEGTYIQVQRIAMTVVAGTHSHRDSEELRICCCASRDECLATCSLMQPTEQFRREQSEWQGPIRTWMI
jgi:hypothetical protein